MPIHGVVIAIVVAAGSAGPLEVRLDPSPVHLVEAARAGANGQVGPYLFGVEHPNLIEAVIDLGVRAYRFPGGTNANGYDAQTGLMYANLRKPIWGQCNDRHPNGVKIQDYMVTANALPGHQAQYVINLVSAPDPTDPSGETGFAMTTTAEFVAEAKRLSAVLAKRVAEGFDPRFIELGNELYLPMWSEAVPDVADYLARLDAFIPAIRGVAPDVPLGVVIPLEERFKNLPDEGSSGSISKWVVPSTVDFDAVILHAYHPLTLELKKWYEGEVDSIEDVATNWFVAADRGIESAMEFTQANYPERDVWVTEWGVLRGGWTLPAEEWPRLMDSTIIVMHTASMYLELLRYDQIDLANAHYMIKFLNPDENVVFDPYSPSGMQRHFNELIVASSAVGWSSVRTDPATGSVIAPIDTGDEGWGGEHAPAIADALLSCSDEEFHWVAVNRLAQSRQVDLHVGDLGVGLTRVTRTAWEPPGVDQEGTVLLMEPPLVSVQEMPAPTNGVLSLELTGMAAADFAVRRERADVDRDGLVGIGDLLHVIDAWGACDGCDADINLDGQVGVTDLLAVIGVWGLGT